MDETECPGCGATDGVRAQNGYGNDLALRECPHCGTLKCAMCDMGDDVECISCDEDAE